MILELRDVKKSYQIPGSENFQNVLKGVSFKVEKGETVAVTGPSGSGKSTLLNLIGSLDKPDSGDIILKGRSTSDLSVTELAKIRNRETGFIFQMHHLLPQCTVIENILLPTVPSKKNPDIQEITERAERLLHRVGLADKKESRPGQLSGGESQRVAFVRALINSPSLILADEPTGSLDTETSAKLMELLLDLNREEDLTMIVVTHSSEIAGLMDRRLEIRNGGVASV